VSRIIIPARGACASVAAQSAPHQLREQSGMAGETLEIHPLSEEDDSPTIMIPADSVTLHER